MVIHRYQFLSKLLCRYAAELAKKLKPQSINHYLNVIRIIHLEYGYNNLLADQPAILGLTKLTLVRGIGRDKDNLVQRNLPITVEILVQITNSITPIDSQQLTFWLHIWLPSMACFVNLACFPAGQNVMIICLCKRVMCMIGAFLFPSNIQRQFNFKRDLLSYVFLGTNTVAYAQPGPHLHVSQEILRRVYAQMFYALIFT